MSHTIRRTENVRSYWSREAKWARKMTNRRHRRLEREALFDAENEDLAFPEPEHTGGWITH